MTEDIEKLCKKTAIKDVEIALHQASIAGSIIPEVVFEIISEVEKTYE